jgi:hypothetical protein
MRAKPCPDHDAVGIDGLAVLAAPLSGADGAEEAMFGKNPHELIVPKKIRSDLLGGMNLVISGGIQVNQEIAILAIEPNWQTRPRPVDDAAPAIVGIKIDADFVGSGPAAPAATNLEVVNARDIHGYFDVSLVTQRR